MTLLSGLANQYDDFMQFLIINKKDFKLADIKINLKCEEKRRAEKKQDKTKSNDIEQAFFLKGKQFKKPLKY